VKIKKSLVMILTLTAILLGSNVYALTVVSGTITFDELHYGYFNTPKAVYWGGPGLEGDVHTVVDSQNNIVTAFFSQSFSTNKEVYIVKFNSQLNELWNTTWGNTDNATVAGVFIDKSNYIYVVGSIYSQVVPSRYIHNVFALKFRPNGSLLWEAIHQTPNLDEVANSGVFDQNSNTFFVVGTTNSSSGSMFVKKFSKSGNYLTTFYYGSPSPSEELEVGGATVDDNGDIFIAALTNKTLWGNPTNYVLVKLNGTTGNLAWNVTSGALELTTRGVDVAVDNGIAYLVGDLISSAAPSNQYTFLVSINATTGVINWNTTLDYSPDYQYSAGITVNRHGNPVITGFVNAATADVFTAEFNTTGSLLWNHTFVKAFSDVASDIISKDDYLYIAATAYNGTSLKDQVMLLIYEDNYTFDFPTQGPFGTIFGIIFGVIVCVFSLVLITGLLYTYWKK